MKKTATTLPLVLLTLAFWILLPAAAQTEQADAFFQNQNWEQAATAYQALAEQNPEDGRAWYRLGMAHHRMEHFDAATKAWRKADALGFAPVFTQYNLASAYARLKNNDEAFAWLDKALAAGFNRANLLQTDTDLDHLRDDARFDAFVEQVDRRARPCLYTEAHRQFDFWVGEWDVFTPQGQQAGANRVEKMLNGCVLQENWLGTGAAPGAGGKSFNFYDEHAGQWKQVWVDAGGNTATFAGTFTDGAMRFEGVWTNQNGTASQMKMTFTPLDDGRVRQYIEQSLDDGATWNVWFDGYYTPKPNEGE